MTSAEMVDRIKTFEAAHASPEAGALLLWAGQCVEALHYLGDLDAALWKSSFEGHNPDVADIAHVRWATGTCVTALDLCAAGLGRAYCGNQSGNEFAVRYFDPDFGRSAKALERRAQLPSAAVGWIDGLLSDARFSEVKSARDWLTHSRMIRHFAIGPGDRRRLELTLGDGRVGVRQIIEVARDVATDQVGAFFDMLPACGPAS